MGFTVRSVPKSTGGEFADLKGLAQAHALLIEPKRLEGGRPSKNYGPKDTIHADVTVFQTAADVEAATPSAIKPGVMFQGSILVRDLTSLLDEATICTVSKETFSTGNSGWVMNDVSPAIEAKVVEYGTAREEALAADMESGPDF